MKNGFSEKYKVWLFHLILWSIWLYLPLSNARDEELSERALMVVSFILLEHIPMFLINTEWLIPKILKQRGATVYLWSLLVLIAIFSVFNGVLYDFFIQNWLTIIKPKGRNFFWNIVPTVFVAAISTGYGLFSIVVRAEQIQQEKQQERLLSELAFLRSQISPHFIFNVLNSIVYLIRSKSDLAENVTLKLSELLRYMLYESENAQIPLEKELSYLKNYIALQKLRFEEDVEINLSIEPSATSSTAAQPLIEPMLMIPFVENAFKHGVGWVENPTIDIVLRLSETDLQFSVRNKIAAAAAAPDAQSAGIGLRNVRRRLELLYPNAHRLSIEKTENWFVVQLQLSFLKTHREA